MWTYVLRHYQELRAIYGRGDRPPADGGPENEKESRAEAAIGVLGSVAVRGGARG
jgi:hypothetical protein